MPCGFISELEGRALFGADARNYDSIRPPYPEQIYDFLRQTGALRPNVATLEIGAGSGLATRRLLDLGANPLTIVEPDPRFTPLLASIAQAYTRRAIHRMETSFEDALLQPGHYDLVAAATSFHWVHPAVGLHRIAAILKPGGCVALWWHVFGDPERGDPYDEATRTILEPLASSPSGAPDEVPYALDFPARAADFLHTGKFEAPECVAFRWTLTLDTKQVGALYATFASISRLPEDRRSGILCQLMEVAETRFGGRVERNMVSPVYVARRKANA